jgi:isopenicillin-N N-acyltransferase-like protein
MNELFQYIECAGGPYERGRQYGEAAREAIRANLTARQPRPPDPAQVRTACAMLERHAAEVYAELQGLAEGSGAPLEKLVQEACTGSPPPAQCTSMAIAAGAEGPVLGKNNDGADDGRRWVVRRTNPDHGHPMLQVLSAGWLSGLDTMNAAGLVNGHSSVGSALARERDSLEIRLWTHALMQRCGTVADFLDGLRALPLNGKGFNLVVADAQGRVWSCVIAGRTSSTPRTITSRPS